MKKIISSNDTENANKAIAIPDYLTSPDGRRFIIQNWVASVCAGSCVVINSQFIVELEADEE